MNLIKELEILLTSDRDTLKDQVEYAMKKYVDGTFRLSGSRYFQSREDIMGPDQLAKTDWDFYCQYSDELFEELKTNMKTFGYAKSTDEIGAHARLRYPFDDQAVAIFVLTHPDHQEINVVMRKDAEMYDKVQERIETAYYVNYLWKSGPNKPGRTQIQDFYNQAYKLVV